MKTKLIFLCLLFSVTFVTAQQASDYFPAQTGYVWNFKVTPLDSLNNEIDSLSYYRIDTFATTANYQGKLANIIPTKSGPLQTILNQPYLDSLFIHLSGSDGFEYFKVGGLGAFLSYLDSLRIDTTFNFLGFIKSLEDWYSVYRFASIVDNEYTIFSIDTSIHYGFLEIPITFEYLGTRLQDETIQTEIGSFNCKKFLIKKVVSALLFIPPPIEVVSAEDYIWIAQDNWIVKDYAPSVDVDLSFLTLPAFYIPGSNTIILAEIVGVENEINLPDNFVLLQNYPNPFNPTTKIKFRIQESGFVSLKVYNVLGKEVAALVNEEKPTGNYEVEFDASGLSSGVYFYQLRANNIIETKKMVLLR